MIGADAMSFPGTEQEFSGHLVKKIRKFFGLRQYEIVGDQITRNLISLIENNKIPLTSNAAAIIVENVNRVAKEKPFGFQIEEKDLRIEGLFEARHSIDQYLKLLENQYFECPKSAEITFSEINNLLNHWDFPDKKALLFLRAANYYHDQRDYESACLNYLKAFENVIRTDDVDFILELTASLIHCSLEAKKYNEALKYAAEVSALGDFHLNPRYAGIRFSAAQASKALGDYQGCLNEIASLENNFPEFSTAYSFELEMMKGRCLMYLGELASGRTIFESLLATAGDTCQKLHVLSSQIQLLIKQGASEDLSVYQRGMAAELEVTAINSPCYAPLSLELAKIHQYFKDYDSVQAAVCKSVESAKLTRNIESIENGLSMLNDPQLELRIDDEKIAAGFKLLVHEGFITAHSKILLDMIRFMNRRRLHDALEEILQTLMAEST